MKKRLTIDEFIERVKNKESVSRFEFEYDFEWDENNSERLRCVLEKITGANLEEANLKDANLEDANLKRANLKVKSSVGCIINFISDEYEQARQFIEGLKP